MKAPSKEYAPWSLIDAYQGGDNDAGEELLRRNRGMIEKIAHGYLRPRLDLDDLLQQARIGLLVGFGKCERKKCGAASPASYAFMWARAHVQQFALDHGSDVRVPRRALAEKKRRGRVITWALKTSLSLEDPIASHSSGAVQTILAVLSAPDGLDEVREQNLFAIVVAELVGSLTCRERDVIARRFGLFGYDEQTGEEIARAFGVSRQRVNQIESRALTKLRLAAQERGYAYVEDLGEVA